MNETPPPSPEEEGEFISLRGIVMIFLGVVLVVAILFFIGWHLQGPIGPEPATPSR